MAHILSDPAYLWQSEPVPQGTLHFAGRAQSARDAAAALPAAGLPSPGDISAAALLAKGPFALILEAPDYTLAVADRVRSYPVFYHQAGDRLWLGGAPRLVKAAASLDRPDPLALLEFRMAGYVTGPDTLYQGLHQLQAGEWLLHRPGAGEAQRERYFLFTPQQERTASKDDLIQELDEATDAIFHRTMEDAAGRPIWVPLSGGLDSRLVLCKFKALGYDNLHAFSYGPPGNHEAKAARYVAAKVGAPWTFLPSTRRSARAFFHTPFRRDYWRYSDLLCALPITQEIQTLWENREHRTIPEGAVIVNGNSGDFISGGHAPKLDPAGTYGPADLVRALVDKHFALWPELVTPENTERLAAKIRTLLPPLPERMDYPTLARLFEHWEWQERQCKYVVNGERNYDYMGFAWALPLWADEYLDFWRDVPLPLRMGQGLFKEYLERRDFYGVFRNFPFTIWRWPGLTRACVPAARAAKLLLGPRAGDAVYRFFGYWGHYSNLYAHYGLRIYLAQMGRIRSYNSLNSLQVLAEEGLSDERLLP